MFIESLLKIFLPVQPVVEEVLPNPPPDQPEWVRLFCCCVGPSQPHKAPKYLSGLHLFFQIKALISAPPTESTPSIDAKKTEEPVPTPVTEPPVIAPRPKPTNISNTQGPSKALGLLGKRTFEK